MQIASLFCETAKLLGASMDDGGMENPNCMKVETAARDDGYETCVDPICAPKRHECGQLEQLRPADDFSQIHLRHLLGPSKMDHFPGDPYSFVEEAAVTLSPAPTSAIPPPKKKRGRRRKSETEEEMNGSNCIERDGLDLNPRDKRRNERFNGLSEAEVSLRTLPDHLRPNLDIVIIGINPGLFAAYKGHHYAGPGNHFWKCLFLSGLIPDPLTSDDDHNLIRNGIGFTNMVARPTKGSADLTRREIKQGCQILLDKIQKFRPKIAVFNGKLIYEVFSGKKDFPFGRQKDFVEGTNTYIWVMPSSSARCAQLPRAADKVPFYKALKKFRDYLNGLVTELDESEVVFNEPKAATKVEAEERKDDPPPDVQVPEKKKRGRPRKGMEKRAPTPRLVKKVKEEESRVVEKPPEGQRRRRGRPKKTREEPPVGNPSPDVLIESSRPSSIGNCQTQTGSSVSSGYSTGTNGEERRREESLSNTGSGGPSPSHHSFTTQSDLSSEISAAISCGSPPPSPFHGHPDPPFDVLGGREEGRRKGKPHDSFLCSSARNFYPRAPQEAPFPGYSSYDEPRLEDLSGRPFDNQPYPPQPPGHRPIDEALECPPQTQSGMPYMAPYENKPLDVSSKSLSGLESLVDQIPSIAESDVGLPLSGSGGCISAHPDLQGGMGHQSGQMGHSSYDASAGFLPYNHSGGYAGQSYPGYYQNELGPGFGVNPLGPTYCPPPPSSVFGYGGYGQCGNSPGGTYSAPPYLPGPSYSPSYPNCPPPNPYGGPLGGNGPPGSQRFAPRLHFRQEDLGHMPFGGF